jgi:hypothetical protein
MEALCGDKYSQTAPVLPSPGTLAAVWTDDITPTLQKALKVCCSLDIRFEVPCTRA